MQTGNGEWASHETWILREILPEQRGDFQQNVLVLVGPTAVVTLHLWKNRVDFTGRTHIVSNCIPTLIPMAVTNESKPQSAENIIRGILVSPISPKTQSVETPVGHPK